MREALVFNGASNLDFQEIRSNVIRIPEVVSRIREAQKIWDQKAQMPLDLANFLSADDAVFLNNIRLKGFATAVVQVGLLDRFLRNHRLPDYLVGASNGDSALKVAAGLISFEEMVSQSPALTNLASRQVKGSSQSPSLELPVLTGIQLVEYSVFKRTETGVEAVPAESRDMEKMVVELVERLDVERLIMVGPGHAIFGRKMRELTDREVQVLESIDADPLLSWFWGELKENRVAVAN